MEQMISVMHSMAVTVFPVQRKRLGFSSLTVSGDVLLAIDAQLHVTSCVLNV